jgi:1,2-dihydroxy-3-keto-5-methylthiopentene dioxygenase
MRLLFLLIASFASTLLAMDKFRIYDEADAEHPLCVTSEYTQISSELNAIGVRFEKWDDTHSLSSNAREEDVFSAYDQEIEKLAAENNYQTVDIVRMFPDNPNKVELRNKFLSEHTHTEDEVRLFVEGSALFYMHVKNKVFITLCEKGDLISIPANYAHWFDMGESPHFTAIRFFTDPSGWVAHFTESQIAKNFPCFE